MSPSHNKENQRTRTTLNSHQIHVMKEFFYNKSSFISPGDKQLMAIQLNLPVNAVENWFKNERTNAKSKGFQLLGKPSSTRIRTKFDKEQKKLLEIGTQLTKRLKSSEVNIISASLGISPQAVRDFFSRARLGNKNIIVRDEEKINNWLLQLRDYSDRDKPMDDSNVLQPPEPKPDSLMNQSVGTNQYSHDFVFFPSPNPEPFQNLPINQPLSQNPPIDQPFQPQFVYSQMNYCQPSQQPSQYQIQQFEWQFTPENHQQSDSLEPYFKEAFDYTLSQPSQQPSSHQIQQSENQFTPANHQQLDSLESNFKDAFDFILSL